MEEKKESFKRKVVYVLIVVGIVYGFIALLNGRYVQTNCDGYMAIFDQWKGEYVSMKTHNR